MPRPPLRKPGPPVPEPVSTERPTKPARPRREAFIGNESATMMADETFEEFQARMKAAEEADDDLDPPTEG